MILRHWCWLWLVLQAVVVSMAVAGAAPPLVIAPQGGASRLTGIAAFFAIVRPYVNASVSYVTFSQCRSLCAARHPKAYVAVATTASEQQSLLKAAVAAGYKPNEVYYKSQLTLGAVRDSSGRFVWVEGPLGRAHNGAGTPFWQTNVTQQMFTKGVAVNQSFQNWKKSGGGEPNNCRWCPINAGRQEAQLMLYEGAWNDGVDGVSVGCVCRVDATGSLTTSLSSTRKANDDRSHSCSRSISSGSSGHVPTVTDTISPSSTASLVVVPGNVAPPPSYTTMTLTTVVAGVGALMLSGASSGDAITFAAIQRAAACGGEDTSNPFRFLVSPFADLGSCVVVLGNVSLVGLVLLLQSVVVRGLVSFGRFSNTFTASTAARSPNVWLISFVIWFPGAVQGAVMTLVRDTWWLGLVTLVCAVLTGAVGGRRWGHAVAVATSRGHFSLDADFQRRLRTFHVPRLLQPTGAWRPVWVRRQYGVVIASVAGKHARWVNGATLMHACVSAAVSGSLPRSSLPASCAAVLTILAVLSVVMACVLLRLCPYRVRVSNALSILTAVANAIVAGGSAVAVLRRGEPCAACEIVQSVFGVVVCLLFTLKVAVSVFLWSVERFQREDDEDVEDRMLTLDECMNTRSEAVHWTSLAPRTSRRAEPLCDPTVATDPVAREVVPPSWESRISRLSDLIALASAARPPTSKVL